MIQTTPITDRDRWNQIVASLPCPHILQSWEWGAFKGRHGWEPTRLAFEQGERVRGAIYEVTESCLQRLDRYESGYSRLKITVFGEDDEPIKAITYVKDDKLEDAAPSKEYLAVIQQGLRDWRLF